MFKFWQHWPKHRKYFCPQIKFHRTPVSVVILETIKHKQINQLKSFNHRPCRCIIFLQSTVQKFYNVYFFFRINNGIIIYSLLYYQEKTKLCVTNKFIYNFSYNQLKHKYVYLISKNILLQTAHLRKTICNNINFMYFTYRKPLLIHKYTFNLIKITFLLLQV